MAEGRRRTGVELARNGAGHVNQSQTMKGLISHGKMLDFYVGCYGEVVLGKEMTQSVQHIKKI